MLPYEAWELLQHSGTLAVLVAVCALFGMAVGVLVTGALWSALRWLTSPSATARRLRKEGKL